MSVIVATVDITAVGMTFMTIASALELPQLVTQVIGTRRRVKSGNVTASTTPAELVVSAVKITCYLTGQAILFEAIGPLPMVISAGYWSLTAAKCYYYHKENNVKEETNG